MNITGSIEPQAAIFVGIIERGLFTGCHVHAGTNPLHRVVLKDGLLKRCKSDGCWIAGAVIADVTVETLFGGGRLGTWLRGCVFSNVVIKGRIESAQWQRDVSNDPDANRLFDADAAERYESIHFALDIADATFDGYTIFEGIPPALIRRNKRTQFLLRREAIDEVRASSPSLLVVCKSAQSEPDGVVFTFGTQSERDKRRTEECIRLQGMGLLE